MASQIINSLGVEQIYDVIIQNEFETDHDKDKTLELLIELARPFKTSIFSLVAFPGTDICNYYKSEGIVPAKDPYFEDYLDHDEADWYYKMTAISGSVAKETFTYLYSSRSSNRAKNLLNDLFFF